MKNMNENEKCTHLLPRSPEQIIINKHSFAEICTGSNAERSDEFMYIFVPYRNDEGNFFNAYVEVNKKYLQYLLERSEDNVVDLVSNFKILHIEPGSYVSQARRDEISDFFDACRDFINYPQMAVA